MFDGAAMDPRTAELLRLVAAALEPQGLYAIGGAFALRAAGYARYTADIDVFALEEHRGGTLRALRQVGLIVEPVFAPHHYVAHLEHHWAPPDGDTQIRIDVLFPAAEPELSAIEFPERVKMAGVSVNVFPVTLLVATKFYSNRPEDHHDIAALFNRGLFDPDAVQRSIESIDPQGAVDFAAEMETLKHPKPTRPRPKRKVPR